MKTNSSTSAAPVAPAHRCSILIVDDSADILHALRDMLAALPIDIDTEASPLAAIELLRKKPYAAILSDQLMPEMSGLEFLAKARKIQESASLILVTGVPSLDTVIKAINDGDIFRFVSKPWNPAELIATVQNAVARYQLIEANQRLMAETQELNAQLQETNNRLEEKVQELSMANAALARNFDQSLELCHKLISTFSPMLGRDTRAVVEICANFCEQGEFSEKDRKVMMVSAWLHNIGLLGVSRDLLSRAYSQPRQLSDKERSLIESHPIYGQAIASFVDNLEEVGWTIRAHHERWDGSGYPDRLQQENIPLVARYLAVATAYVESKLPRAEAIERIIKGSGKAFYPDAVRLFLKVTQLAPLPRQIREITLNELREGMTMASDLHSPAGLLLLPEGQRITEDILRRIRHHNMINSLTDRILVYI